MHTEPQNELQDITERFSALTDLEKGISGSKCSFAQCVFLVFSFRVIWSFQFLYNKWAGLIVHIEVGSYRYTITVKVLITKTKIKEKVQHRFKDLLNLVFLIFFIMPQIVVLLCSKKLVISFTCFAERLQLCFFFTIWLWFWLRFLLFWIPFSN